MKLILAFALLTFSTIATADVAQDAYDRKVRAERGHEIALRQANKTFNANAKKCQSVTVEADRNKCLGAAKAKHTKAVEKADSVLAKASKS